MGGKLYNKVCFHGTDKVSGDSILTTNFNVSNGDEHWLGNGVYFFEENAPMAYEWCKCEGHKRNYREYMIIKTDVQVKVNELLDLFTDEGSALFHGHRNILTQRLKKAKFGVGLKNKELLDGKIINDLCSFFPYKVILSKFFIKAKNDRIYRLNSRIPNCTVVCVRDISCIDNKSTLSYKEGELNEH